MKISIPLPDIETQKKIAYGEGIKAGIQQLEKNISAPSFSLSSGIDVSGYSTAHLLTEEAGWEPPPAALVDAWFTQFKQAIPEYNSDKKLGYLLGMTGANTDRRIRTFRNGERPIPYGIWRRFLVITGRVNQEVYEVVGFFSD
ncbi:TPA: hypothetical protein QIF36_002376 [Enterobacter kobei]|nr:hypothetical protein [Enterobacter kobei]